MIRITFICPARDFPTALAVYLRMLGARRG